MGDVEAYLDGLPEGADRQELERLDVLVRSRVPNVSQGRSYNMPCYMYREHPVASIMATKKHLAWYPFSGKVIGSLTSLVEHYSCSVGTLRFHPEQPLGDELVTALLVARMREIDEKLESKNSD